jgi:hypothetical protein
MKALLFALFLPFAALAKYPIEYPMTLTKVDRAAIHVLDSINPISIKHDIEFGGSVYINHSYDVRASIPQTDSNSHSVLIEPDTAIIVLNFMKVANYHTHAAQNPDYLDETFSSTDTTKTRFKEYLATPMGKILKYDPRLGEMLILNRTKGMWEKYVFVDPNPEPDTLPVSPKLRLYDKIPPSILEN